jgi:hypothetical protein
MCHSAWETIWGRALRILFKVALPSWALRHVIRIFSDEQSALRLIRALAVEIHEDWIEAHRYF